MNDLTSPQALAIFNEQQAVFGEPTPFTGDFQGEWPAAGESANVITGLAIDTAAETLLWSDAKDAPKVTIPAISFEFHYQLAEDADRPEPLQWHGKRIVLASPAKMTVQKQKDFQARERNRLAGFFKVLNGVDPGPNLLEAAQQLVERLESGNPMVATIKADYYTNPTTKKVSKTDYAVKLLAS